MRTRYGIWDSFKLALRVFRDCRSGTHDAYIIQTVRRGKIESAVLLAFGQEATCLCTRINGHDDAEGMTIQ